MLVWDLVRTCLRRWYIIVLGLALTAGGTYWVYENTPVTYEATGSIVLIPPRDSVLVGDNPYLYLGGLEQALGVLSVRLMSQDVVEPLAKQFPDTEFVVVKDVTTAGPIMAITITGKDSELTMGLLHQLISLVPAQMTELQKTLEVPDASWISTQKLAEDNEPAEITKNKMRLVAMVGAGGTAVTLLFTALFDRVLSALRTKRRLRREAKSQGIDAALELQGPETARQSLESFVESAQEKPRTRRRGRQKPEAETESTQSTADLETRADRALAAERS